MAKTIPQLTDATTVNAADELIIQQGGITKRATGAELAKGLNTLNGIFHVKDFGAVGDGAAGDGAAIQAAIDAAHAAGGGHVMFEAKTYIIGAPRLGWRSNVILHGTGTTVLKVQNGIDQAVIAHNASDTATAVTNVGAIGIIFDGNQANAPRAIAASVVSLDPVDGAYFERCVFRNASGYGMGMQFGTPSLAPNNDRVKNVLFVKCAFNNNGTGSTTSGTKYDGIDVKNCDRVILVDCEAHNNAHDGFDFRGNRIEMYGCFASGNVQAGVQISANGNGFTQDSSLTICGGTFNANRYGFNIANNPAGGSGKTITSATGATFSNNTEHGIRATSSNTNTYASVNSCLISGNTINGIDLNTATLDKQFVVSSCTIINNTGNGIETRTVGATNVIGGLIQGNGGYGIEEGAGAGRNSYSSVFVRSNTLGSFSFGGSRLSVIDPTFRDYLPGSTGSVIASATNITLPAGGNVFYLTGSTAIDSITLSHRDRVVTLIFAGNITANDSAVGGNLRLNGNFVATPNDTLALVCNDDEWLEVSRSDNG
jgi:hypothetical protein